MYKRARRTLTRMRCRTAFGGVFWRVSANCTINAVLSPVFGAWVVCVYLVQAVESLNVVNCSDPRPFYFHIKAWLVHQGLDSIV